MNNILTLAKYSLKEDFFAYMPRKTVPNMPKNFFARILILIWTYVFFGFIFTGVFKASAAIYVNTGQDYMYFVNFAVSLTLMVFIFYISQIFSNLYTKSAIANYQTMPIKEGELFVGRLIGSVLGFVDFFAFFIIGLFIYFGEKAFDPWVLVMGLILYFPMILIPYGLISLVLLVIKKFTNVNRYEKVFKTLGYILMFALMGVIYYFSFSSSASGEGFDISKVTDLMGTVSNVFINAKVFGLALAGTMRQRVIYSLALILASGLILLIAYKLADKFYYEAVFDEHRDTRKKKDTKVKNVDLEESSQFKAIFKKDLRTLFSNIVFLSGPITMALIFVIMGFTTGRTIMAETGPIDKSDYAITFVIVLISFAIGLLVWINGGLANTSLSREGKSFYLIQTMPIDPKSHMLARYASSMLVATFINIIIALAYTIILGLGALNGLAAFVGLSLGAAIATIVSLYFGTFMVYTSWKKPQEINQSGGLRAAGIYLFSMLVIGLLGGLVFLITVLTDNIMLALGLISALIVIITALIARACYKRYKKGFMDVG